jgi:RHS repeat-associated protein
MEGRVKKMIRSFLDAAGNRIGKTVGSTSTWYVRDAQGNILATYSGENMALQEQDLYGSSRLGMISNAGTLSNTAQYLDHLGSGTLFTFTRGKKLFELTNHLGNVLATVSDKKFGTPVTGIPSQISYYTADVKSAQDYYPFGMEMPGRQYNATYPYSFNGKRDDKDAEYGWQDYGMREYDRKRAQFISVDPLTQKYPYYSPYQFGSNMPIAAIDIDGMETSENKNESENKDSKQSAEKSLIEKLDEKLLGGAGKNHRKVELLQETIKNQAEEVLRSKSLKEQAFENLLNSDLGSDEGKINSILYNKYEAEEQKNTKALTWAIGELYKAQVGDKNIKNFNNYVNAQLNTLIYGTNIMAAASAFMPSGGISSTLFTFGDQFPIGMSFREAIGGLKQWVRIGSSFSRASETSTWGIR